MDIILWVILAVLVLIAIWFGFSFLVFISLAYLASKAYEEKE